MGWWWETAPSVGTIASSIGGSIGSAIPGPSNPSPPPPPPPPPGLIELQDGSGTIELQDGTGSIELQSG